MNRPLPRLFAAPCRRWPTLTAAGRVHKKGAATGMESGACCGGWTTPATGVLHRQPAAALSSV